MRLFLVAVFSILTVLPSHANAADPDGILQYCQEKLNQKKAFNCDCMVEKYYPKKAELEQLYGVPIPDVSVVMMHITAACTNVEKTEENEYKICMESITFKTSKNEFGAERFCKCYASEWGKNVTEYVAIPNNVIDKNSRRHLKGLSRATCKRKLQ